MQTAPTILTSLAHIFEYPQSNYLENVYAARNLCGSAAGEEIELFAKSLAGQSVHDLEELFTRTFDINPVASLEVGWHIYGEQYERGTFLVNMRARLRDRGIEEGTELPDHLTSVLRLLAALDAEEAAALSSQFLLPALKKIQEPLAAKKNPYSHAVEAVSLIVEEMFIAEEGVQHHV
ncbi:MAG: nitrate reductase molybdenum cofactor assembly chaperone [Ectothiorhodospiraceae bacterium]|nr:nitrate reductase molybdenum cofactor assembly chaperone [Ectothiorhodospiraceae bacterium]